MAYFLRHIKYTYPYVWLFRDDLTWLSASCCSILNCRENIELIVLKVAEGLYSDQMCSVIEPIAYVMWPGKASLGLDLNRVFFYHLDSWPSVRIYI